ncbi:MAG: hypothetical protein AAF160_18055 [Pseudomonadota bacterium]
MRLSRRSVLRGTACAAVISMVTAETRALAALRLAPDPEEQALLLRFVRVMYPHKQFPDGPYGRTAEAARAGAATPAAKALMFAEGMHDLREAGFAEMSEDDALDHLRSIEDTAFFQHVRGTVVTTLYNDPEVWALLGYEGPSYDQGGYIDRGFNDLDWLPEPRVTEL